MYCYSSLHPVTTVLLVVEELGLLDERIYIYIYIYKYQSFPPLSNIKSKTLRMLVGVNCELSLLSSSSSSWEKQNPMIGVLFSVCPIKFRRSSYASRTSRMFDRTPEYRYTRVLEYRFSNETQRRSAILVLMMTMMTTMPLLVVTKKVRISTSA